MVAITFPRAFGCLAALTAAASAQVGTLSGQSFKIVTCASSGSSKTFSNMYLASFATGVGENPIITHADPSLGSLFQTMNGTGGTGITFLTQAINALEFFIVQLDPARPKAILANHKLGYTAPKGYGTVDLGLIGQTPGFGEITGASSSVTSIVFDATKANPALNFGSFAVCPVNTIQNYLYGGGRQLMFRQKTVKRAKKCADVVLKALMQNADGSFPAANCV